jgi:hypothetical protein
MDDHDQRLKTVLELILPEFFQDFLPEWADRFVFAQSEFLPQEAFLDPPQGERRELDLVVRLPIRPEFVAETKESSMLAIIHLEIQGQGTLDEFRPRMFEYYEFLKRKHRLPILPVVMFFHLALDGIGRDVYEETFFDYHAVRFEYFYIALPGLNAEEWIRRRSLAGITLSGLMRRPKENRAVLKYEGLERIIEVSENDYQRSILLECFDNYFKLNENEEQEVVAMTKQKVATPHGMRYISRYEQAMIDREREVTQSVTQQVTQSVTQQVTQKERCRSFIILLEKRFGPLSDDRRARISELPIQRLDELFERAISAATLEEVGLEG